MQRFYRENMNADDLVYYRVMYKETDLYIGTTDDRSDECREIITSLRHTLEEYIKRHKGFQSALAPISLYKDAPDIDGYLFITGVTRELMTGDYVRVLITGSNEYDLIGELRDEFTK